VLGLRAEEVVHVGDSLTADVAGAQAAGIAAVWVNRRKRPVPDGIGSTTVIGDLADLAAQPPPVRWGPAEAR
jgi:FMN phosphatase YigB (HAD superfamily)